MEQPDRRRLVLSAAGAVPAAAARGRRGRVEEQLSVGAGGQGGRPVAGVVDQVALLRGALPAGGRQAVAVGVGVGQLWGGVGEAGPVDAEHGGGRTLPGQLW